MKKIINIAILLLFQLLADAQHLYNNPVISVSGPDPTIIKRGNYFYLYHTGGYVPIYRSEDLVTWTRIGNAFSNESHPTFVENGGIWAPDGSLSVFGPRLAPPIVVEEHVGGIHHAMQNHMVSVRVDQPTPLHMKRGQRFLKLGLSRNCDGQTSENKKYCFFHVIRLFLHKVTKRFPLFHPFGEKTSERLGFCRPPPASSPIIACDVRKRIV